MQEGHPMGTLEESDHFVPLSGLGSFPDHLTFNEVTRLLPQSNTGGFLLKSGQKPSKYVKTTELAKVVVDLAHTNGARSFGDMPLVELLQNPKTQDAVVLMGAKSYEVETDPSQVMQNKSGLVVAITKGNSTVGVFFTDDKVLKSLASPPPEYKCDLFNHPNPTFGDGTCAYCPGKLNTAP
jgi:hypothetical protein